MATLSPKEMTVEASPDENSEEKETESTLSLTKILKDIDMNKHYDVETENEKLESVINIALLEVDFKTGKQISNPNIKWNIYNTGDENVSVIYRKMDNACMVTMRSSMDFNCTMEEAYEYFDCLINDDLRMAVANDKFMTSYDVPAVYDNDRCLVHTTFSTGVPAAFVRPRDFFYMKKRFKYQHYSSSDKEFVGIVAYSLDEKHPNYVKTLEKHIRGWIHYTGCIVIPKDENICTMVYVVCVDLCGDIPKAIVNFCTPQQGLNIKKFASNIDDAKGFLAKRKKNNKINQNHNENSNENNSENKNDNDNENSNEKENANENENQNASETQIETQIETGVEAQIEKMESKTEIENETEIKA